MTSRKHTQNFDRSGVIVCTCCGKRTRETGRGEGGLGMCGKCIEAQELANGIVDGVYTIDDVPATKRQLVERFL